MKKYLKTMFACLILAILTLSMFGCNNASDTSVFKNLHEKYKSTIHISLTENDTLLFMDTRPNYDPSLTYLPGISDVDYSAKTIEDNGTSIIFNGQVYWLGSADGRNSVWNVGPDNFYGEDYDYSGGGYGVRPVIEIPTSEIR